MASVIRRIRHPRQGRGSFYGWWIVGLSLLLHGSASGLAGGSVGVWMKALESHFHWSRTQLTGAFSLSQMEGSIVGPLMGFLIDRLGTRRVVLMGLLILGLGFIVFSRTENLVVFYLSFALFMVGSATGVWLPMMAAVNNWFIRRRGTAMAVAGEGYVLGGITLVPLVAWAVNPDHLGWRTTALLIGVGFASVAFPVTRLIRNSPEEYGQVPDGEASTTAPNATAEAGPVRGMAIGSHQHPELTAREAMLTSAFWLITAGHALTSMVNSTLRVHLVPMLTDEGLSLQMAAYVWSVVLASAGVFQLVGGYMGDRVPKNQALFVFSTIQAVLFFVAVLVHNAPMAFLFAVIYGIGSGGRVPIGIAIRGDYFGQRSFATILGISMAPMYVLQLLAPLFAAVIYDIRGSYVLPFSILSVLGFFGGVAFLLAKMPVVKNLASADSRIVRP